MKARRERLISRFLGPRRDNCDKQISRGPLITRQLLCRVRELIARNARAIKGAVRFGGGYDRA